jgi:hypothetical protein
MASRSSPSARTANRRTVRGQFKPRYSGKVEETSLACWCKRERGKVWLWTAPVQPPMPPMPSHTKCFRRLWAGER